MEQEKLKSVLEALIFASDVPISLNQLQVILEGVDKSEIEKALAALSDELKSRAFFLKKVGGGWQFATRPEYYRWIKQMFAGRERNRLTRAALETLAIIAFKQPISRVEVAAIRGVNSDGVMQTLLERKLIAITGRDEGQGRALLFSTTKEFLLYFGIDDIADLPKPKEIEELLASGEGQKIIQEIPEEEILEQEVAAENSLDSEFVAAPDPESAVAADQAASTESIPADDAH
ncbi:MAG TPA: SMC-Scp complex subunit ScpB [bacterium]|nr:SMC-Scp complex subunit ScpB [bacterium]HQI49151.1 SMC-Scp complex subunit ScpB [bacterium]HQJ66067.1 SMC-Scp complex subunit ScpB [bacterium]